jgi:hypothetical protein
MTLFVCILTSSKLCLLIVTLNFMVQVSVLQNAHTLVRLRPSDGHSSNGSPVLLWNVLQPDPDVTLPETGEQSVDPTYAHYVCFKFHKPPLKPSEVGIPNEPAPSLDLERSASPVSSWSYPMRLRMTATGMRHSVAVPCLTGDTKTCCMVAQTNMAISYVTLTEDCHPALVLRNLCDVLLYYGQTATETAGFKGWLTFT